jgi:menaquinone reductase, multiheme cytochrome c subunit
MPERSQEPSSQTPSRFVFPRWANYLLPMIVVMVGGAGLYIPTVVGLGGSPRTTDVGYMPGQPVQYSHALHVGQLGMDCRYCHYTVEKAAFAAVPPTQVCINCHSPESGVKPEVAKLLPVQESWKTDRPIEWVKVHDLPDFAYFNHSAHVNKGVGCVTCHGRVDTMETVNQVQPLSMSWCLDCHREPEKFLRPKDRVTDMWWRPEVTKDASGKPTESEGQAQLRIGRELKKQYGIRDVQYMQSCSTCHR